MAGLEEFYTGWRTEEHGGGVGDLEYGFAHRLLEMLHSLPPELEGQITMLSAFRSVEAQQELWENALKKYGSEAAARKWVAKPGSSNHNKGFAADLTYHSDAARKWVHANAARFGLAFHLKHEDWHIEPAGLRDGSYISTGRTYGGSDLENYDPEAEDDHDQGLIPVTADPDAYTDDEWVGADNHSFETQALRIADLVTNTSYDNKQAVRVADPAALANRNMRRGGGFTQ